MKLLKLSEYAKINGVHHNTVRNWIENKEIEFVKTSGGHYRIPENQILHKEKSSSKIVVGYCRVSSSKQKDDLERQVSLVRQYLVSGGEPFEIITDIGSGINYKKKGLQQVLTAILSGKVEKLVVLHKDRLLRFGYELVESIADRYGTQIEIIERVEKDSEQELVEDLVQIITVFSSRLNGKRSHQLKTIAKQL